MDDWALRIADGMLGIFWAVMLVRALASGDFGFVRSEGHPRKDRPVYYAVVMVIYALMVVHFVGLAIVGQGR